MTQNTFVLYSMQLQMSEFRYVIILFESFQNFLLYQTIYILSTLTTK
jgi:hypothetical protein